MSGGKAVPVTLSGAEEVPPVSVPGSGNFGHSLLGYVAAARGLDRLEADRARLADDLDANWEVLAEAVQTVMRRHGIEDAYEQLKALTRGERVTPERLREFVHGLPIPEDAKARLLALTPGTYTGAAPELAKKI